MSNFTKYDYAIWANIIFDTTEIYFVKKTFFFAAIYVQYKYFFELVTTKSAGFFYRMDFSINLTQSLQPIALNQVWHWQWRPFMIYVTISHGTNLSMFYC